MRNFYILIILIFSAITVGVAQTPQGAIFPQNYNSPESLINCMGNSQDAGSFQLGSYRQSALSNDISKERVFLCALDRVPLVHDRNAILDGDPDKSTPAGVGYGFYNCPPSIDGNSLADVAGDNCHVKTPPPPLGDFYVIVDKNTDGDLLLNNDGSLNQNFNSGNPGTWWFAPITFDALEIQNGAYIAKYEQGNNQEGPCVNVRTDQAIEVTYLNPFNISNTSSSSGQNGACNGSFEITGGYPEYDSKASYSITIVSTANRNNRGTLLRNNYKHGETVEYTVPIGGEYEVTIEDGKSCVQSFIIDADCSSLELSAPKIDVGLGEEFCVPITVKNFDTLVTLSFTLQFDPSIITYEDYQGFDIPRDEGSSGVGLSQITQGRLSFIWISKFNPDQQRITLPDGSTLIEFCFRVNSQAKVGDISPLDFGNQITFVEATSIKLDENGDFAGYVDVGVKLDHGRVRIVSDSGLFFSAVSCGTEPGNLDGSFTITAFGGEAPYAIDWKADFSGGPQGSGNISQEEGTYTATDLDYGGYDVTITDANGETYTTKVVVSDDKPRPEFDISVVNPTCHDRNNGKVSLSNLVASEPYNIEWSNGRFNDMEIKNLSAGHYSVTVTDLYGCEVTESRSIKYDKIRLQVVNDEVGCQNQSTATATLTAEGGVPLDNDEYTFKFQDRSQVTGNNVLRENLSYGWHRVTITDKNNCDNIDSFFIDATKKLFYSDITITDATCSDSEDGALSLEPGTQGAAESTPYSIYIVGINSSYTDNKSGTGSISFDNIPADSYQIKLADLSGCEFDTLIVVGSPAPIIVNPELTNKTCEDGGEGSIRLNASGGTGSLTYNWRSNNFFPPPADYIFGLPAGTYNITITDRNGCEFTDSYEITEPDGPTIDHIDRVSISCASKCDGKLSIQASQGPVPIVDYYWVLNGQDTIRGQTINDLCSGVYTAHVVDANGCIDTRIVTLEDPDPLEIYNLLIIEPECANQSTGSIQLFVRGGVEPYTFDWDYPGAENSPTLDNLSGGTYSVTISDAGDCNILIESFTLDSPPAMIPVFSDIRDATCYNTCDGAATISVSGGVTGGPYTYRWQDGSTAQINNNLCAGNNYVVISDGLCTDTFYVNIPSPEAIRFNLIDSIPPTCAGESDGRLSLQATGGSGTYIYDWENGSIDPFRENLTAGEYFLTITDGLGCILDTSIILSEPDVLDLSIDSLADITCPDDQDGYISIDVTGGNGNYTYQWSGGVSNSNFAENLNNGSYTVTVTDRKGCRDTISAVIREPSPINFTLGDITPPLCYGEETHLSILNVNGGNGAPFTGLIADEEISVPGSIDIMAGNHTLSIFDNKGCAVDTSFTINQPPQLEVVVPGSIEVNLGDQATISPQISGVSAPIASYSWDPAEFVDCADCKDITIVLMDSETLTFTVTDDNGCTADATIEVKVNKARNIYIPTAFTPNGDGVNDVFRIYVNSSVEEIEYFSVFDKWGNKIWESREIPIVNNASAIGWNGSYKGRTMNPGVFVFNAMIRFKDGVTRKYAGDISILDRISYE